MKTKKLSIVLAAIVLIAALAGCTPAKSITTGAFNGNAYANDFFGMTFKVPDGWTVASKEQMVDIFKAGQEMIGSNDKDAEKKMELAKQKTLYFAYASKHPIDYAEGPNSNFNLVCENLGIAGLVVKTSKDYAEAAIEQIKKSTEGTDMSYTFGDITTQKIGGLDFAITDATLTYSGVEIKQRLVCTIKNNYALTFTLTWFDDAELPELQTIIDSIEIK